MKKILLLVLLLPFMAISQEIKKEKTTEPVTENKTLTTTAIVEQQENGIYVFSYSLPVKKYRVIGKVKPGNFSSTYTSLINNITKKTIKTYPTASGVIISFNKQSGLLNDEFDVIEFME